MNEHLIFPFGFLRDHLLRQIERRNLLSVSEPRPGIERVIAVGVGGAFEDCRSEDELRKLLPVIDAAFLFSGMAFEGKARARSLASLLRMFGTQGARVQIIDQNDAIPGLRSDVSVFDAMEAISNALLDRAMATTTG
jgi:hypothetical protein